jgi:hypothetical protein
MGFVQGDILTIYCDQSLLSLTTRLELFVGQCVSAFSTSSPKPSFDCALKPAPISLVGLDGPDPVQITFDFGECKTCR